MLVIIGCGNVWRSDDAVGVVVVRELREYIEAHPVEGVRVFDAGTGGMDVIFQARGATRLVIVDAVRSGAEPGAVFRVPGAELAQAHQPAYSLHDFRWDHALHAGRMIFRDDFPADVTVYLIEAQQLGLGDTLSAPVQRGAGQVIAELRKLVDECVEA